MAPVTVNPWRWMVVTLMLALPGEGVAQGLPEFAPMNPVGSSRSGLYFQPYRDPAPNRWTTSVALDYASVIEYNQLANADYLLDSELLRLSAELGRDLDERSFVTFRVSLGGVYDGFMDGFFDWYHGALGIEVAERERRPRDQFTYAITPPGGRTVERSRSDLFLQDLRVALGFRHNARVQSLLSLTVPTSTGPDGYDKGVPSLALLNTFRTTLRPDLVYEGSLSLGITPSHGSIPELQRQVLWAATSGLRIRVWGKQALYANLFYHSPYYRGTTLPSLDRRELSLDFGWILENQQGGDWRVGLTEDLEPGGPGVDLVLRFGRSF